MAAPVRLFRSSWRNLLEKPFYLAHIPKCSRCSSAVSAAPSLRKWQLHSAVCLQRFPVITQETTPLEQKYSVHLQEKEIRHSLMSDYELEQIEERKKLDAQKAAKSFHDVQALEFTMEDTEEKWADELEAFKMGDRITKADKTNNTKSTDRKLDRKLVLVVKYGFDNESEGHWRFPQLERQEGESMREAAERALSTYCGEVNATFLGNAPCGYDNYRLPYDFSEHYGVKVFYFKAGYNNGEITLSDKVTDFKWVTIEELKDLIHPETYDNIEDFFVEY